jgi:hypothetical protein
MSSKKQIYKVIFANQGKVYEIYARNVSQGGLFGFVEIEGLLFGERSSVVVDPSEETLRQEFSGVSRTYIPMHSVLRIDQVEKRGVSTIHSISETAPGKVMPLPPPVYTPVRRDT